MRMVSVVVLVGPGDFIKETLCRKAKKMLCFVLKGGLPKEKNI